MEEKSRGWLFRKRTVLGAALVAGVIVGQYLPDFWNGFGGGSTVGVGIGDSATGSKEETSSDTSEMPAEVEITLPENVPAVIKVVIDDRSFFLRSEEGDRPVEIAEVIALAKAASGDADGVRVRVYRKGNSRSSAENALLDAFHAAKISDDAVVWAGTPLK